MRFKSRLWLPLAGLLSLVNLAAVGFAAGPGEALHATAHAALALGFGLWAQRLRRQVVPVERPSGDEALQTLLAEVDDLRRELSDAEERLEFTERLLSQTPQRQPVNRPPPD